MGNARRALASAAAWDGRLRDWLDDAKNKRLAVCHDYSVLSGEQSSRPKHMRPGSRPSIGRGVFIHQCFLRQPRLRRSARARTLEVRGAEEGLPIRHLPLRGFWEQHALSPPLCNTDRGQPRRCAVRPLARDSHAHAPLLVPLRSPSSSANPHWQQSDQPIRGWGTTAEEFQAG
jgi:hypothetical protein